MMLLRCILLNTFMKMTLAGECTPIDIIMTRASGTKASLTNGTWSTPYGLSTVNTASLQGALKYVITETIDLNDGYTNATEGKCYRKNAVSYIHFYRFTVCNPDAALWWFNVRGAGYGGDKEAYNFGEFGQYLTMDDGKCHDSKFCDYLHGTDNRPDLGPFVGWQNVSNDDRNPTAQSYWYSLPGICPLLDWNTKTGKCMDEYESGECPEGTVPDGETCTWSYTMLGQVSIDELAGITALINPDTEEPFADAEEFCLAGEVEFERDSKTFDFKQGLPFWEDPLNVTANAARIDALIEAFNDDEDNFALPTALELNAANPRCYEAHPLCFMDEEEICTRDQEQLCVPCDQTSTGCADVTDPSTAFGLTALSMVPVFVPDRKDSTDPDSSIDDSAANVASFSFYVMSFCVVAARFM